ncbi:Glutathione S-transferase D5 [Halotydeus destructor]|nr:Glutathione S-transferase D5 [Halotydeus destructor]
MSLVLYYFRNCPFSRTVLTVGNELDLKFDLRHIDLWKKEQQTEEFSKINPLRSVPVLIDGDFKLPNSLAIAQYLVDKYSPGSSLYPSDLKLRALVHRHLYYAESTLVSVTRPVFVPVLNDGLEHPKPEAVAAFEDKLSQLNDFLRGQNYFVGDSRTLADIAIYNVLSLVRMVDFDFSKFTDLQNWLNRISKDLPKTEELIIQFTKELKELALKNRAS